MKLVLISADDRKRCQLDSGEILPIDLDPTLDLGVPPCQIIADGSIVVGVEEREQVWALLLIWVVDPTSFDSLNAKIRYAAYDGGLQQGKIIILRDKCFEHAQKGAAAQIV